MTPAKRFRILGIRGIPAAHGGFETFAERLAIYLQSRGWRVTVYCQVQGADSSITEDEWRGIRRISIAVRDESPLSTMKFDWAATRHATRAGELCLTLGYNTALFSALLRAKGVTNVINMDGIEWRRAKWGRFAKGWLWINDWAGCLLAAHLVADHPEIGRHLQSRVRADKISVIPYGADLVDDAPTGPISALGLMPQQYLTLIARPEPENTVLEIVGGFSRKPRGVELAVLGRYDSTVPYHREIRRLASKEVRFLGPIYDKATVSALRFHSLAYVHGHQVGGTNPSLVEALGAGNAVIAHDNPFNRWVAGGEAEYFRDAESFGSILDRLLSAPQRLSSMRAGSRARFEDAFRWDMILPAYESLLQSLSSRDKA